MRKPFCYIYRLYYLHGDTTILQVLSASAILVTFAVALLVLRLRLLVWVICRRLFPLVDLLLYLLFGRRPTVIIIAFLPLRASIDLLISHIIPNCLRPRGPDPIYLGRPLLDSPAYHLIKGTVVLVYLLVLQNIKLLLLLLLILLLSRWEVFFFLIRGLLSSRSPEELWFWPRWVCVPSSRIIHSYRMILLNEMIQHVLNIWMFAAVWLRALKNLEIADSSVIVCRGTIFCIRLVKWITPIVCITRIYLMLYNSAAQFLNCIIASARLNASNVDFWGRLIVGRQIIGLQY